MKRLITNKQILKFSTSTFLQKRTINKLPILFQHQHQIQTINQFRSICTNNNSNNNSGSSNNNENLENNDENIIMHKDEINKIKDEKIRYPRVIMKPISNKPVIAIIGKPNCGKSTIFNRIIEGQRQALVEEIPGTTRDRYYGEGFLYGREFILVDTGGLIGESKEDKDQFQDVIHQQAEIAMQEADAILFILDFKSGITSVDKELARMLRTKKLGKPIYIGVNKADNVAMRSENFAQLKVEITRLGFGEPIAFSAIHGDGVHTMFEKILSGFPHMDLSMEKLENDLKPGPIKISIVGQPNAGKSSLLNKIINEERAIVSDIPGTTHDPVDCNFKWRNTHEITLIDTAGIKRRSTHKVGLEKSSVLWAMKAIEKSYVVLLVIDATVGLTEQDLKIAGFCIDNKKSMVIIVNKWDLYLENKKASKQISDKLFFHDFQSSNNYGHNNNNKFINTPANENKLFSDSNISPNFTFSTLLDDLIAENKRNSKTDDNTNIIGGKKKKSSILEEKRNRKQSIKKELQQQNEQDELERQKQHSSDLDYSKIYWPEQNKEFEDEPIIDEHDNDDEYNTIDIDTILKSFNQDRNPTEEVDIEHRDYDQLNEEEKDEQFHLLYIKYLKKKEERQEELSKLDIENGGNGRIKRPPPPEVTLPKYTKDQKEFESDLRTKLKFLDFAPVIFTSAKTGFCVPTAIDLSIKIFFEREKRLKVSELLSIIKQATFKHKFPKIGKNALKLKYAQQVKGYPPSFLFWVNDPECIEPSIVRYLLRSIRESYPFIGTPIYIRFKKNKRKPRKIFNKSSKSSSSGSGGVRNTYKKNYKRK